MKRTYQIKGMHCNSCARLIEKELKDEVNKVLVSFANERVEIDFNPEKISENEIKKKVRDLGYGFVEENNNDNENTENINKVNKSDKLGWIFLIGGVILLIFVLYYFFLRVIDIKIPDLGEKTSLFLLFGAGILTGFHCIAMCGGFVFSYTTKNAIRGHKGFKQHLVYGGSKVISYIVIGGIFGLIGGIFAFSVGLRGWIAILAGIFMIFYALSMFGIKFFKKFQFNPKFLTEAARKAGASAKGHYKAPFVTGLLNGLFIACGPLQAMYIYAAGTGSFVSGATSLAAFGLGTLPIMLGFGTLATAISHKATSKILKISAIIVLALGLIMLNRGLALTGSSWSYDSIKARIMGGNSGSVSTVTNGVQEINMGVSRYGYNPNSFVLKKDVPVKWNIDVKALTGCNNPIIVPEYNLNIKLKEGKNVIEFTPEKTGVITFSCWMGMLRGNFIVTDTGTATQEEIKTAAPKAGGSCGCGG